MADYDLAIIGGGINGAAIARDAAGRGVRVVLFEQSDLASGTSSASTKLIHGGLRYLEHGALRMVRGALAEREVLLKNAPHIIRPMRFVLPAVPGPRSPQMLRFGLFLYDRLGRRRILPGTQTVDLTHNPAGHPLMRRFIMGYEYSDCWVDDSRLVVLNAIDAAERGATIRTRTRVARAEREAGAALRTHIADAVDAFLSARTRRFDLPGGLKAALIPKATRGQVVQAQLVLHFGDEHSLFGWRDAPAMLAALLDKGTVVAGVFTKSRCPSAPVDFCRQNLAGGVARAVVVNSGNANAFTGKKGKAATDTPMLSEIEPMDAKKLTWPGRLTAPKVVVAATATPAASCQGPSSMPSQCAT